MSGFLIAFIVLLYTFQSFLCKKYSDNYPGDPDTASPIFTVVSGLIVAFVSLALSGFAFSAGTLTVLLALVNGIALFGYNMFLIKASQCGSYSVLMMCNLAGGIILPSLVAILFFDDELTWVQGVSVLATFVAVYMVSLKKPEIAPEAAGAGEIEAAHSANNSSKLFPVFCLLLAICNGTYGSLLDAQQRLAGTAEREEMVALTYIFAVLLSSIALAIQKKKAFFASFKQTKVSLIFLITCSLIVATAVNLLVYLIPLVNITVLYTFDNAGVMLLSVILSCVFFKEKLSAVNIIGCIIMAASFVCLSIF